MRSLYWSKSGDWYEVPVCDRGGGVRRRRARQRVAPSARSAARVAGSSSRGAGSGPGRNGSSSTPCSSAVTAGPARTGHCRGLSTSPAFAYSGPTAMGAALGMDKLAFGALMLQAGLPALPRIAFERAERGARVRAAVHLEAALWRLIDRSRGRRGLRDRSCTPRAPTPTSVGVRCSSPTMRRCSTCRSPLEPGPNCSCRPIERPLRTRGGGEILGYQDKYVGSEGMTSAPRELPAEITPDLERRIRAAGDRRRLARRPSRRRPARFPVRRRRTSS